MRNLIIAALLVSIIFMGCTGPTDEATGEQEEPGMSIGEPGLGNGAEPQAGETAAQPGTPPAFPEGAALGGKTTYTNPMTGAVVLPEPERVQELIAPEQKVLVERGLTSMAIADTMEVVATAAQETVDYKEVQRAADSGDTKALPYEFQLGAKQTVTNSNSSLWTCVEAVVMELNQLGGVNYVYDKIPEYDTLAPGQIHDSSGSGIAKVNDAKYKIAQSLCVYQTGGSPITGNVSKWNCYVNALESGKEYTDAATECYGTA